MDKRTRRYIGEVGLARSRRQLGAEFEECDEASWVFLSEVRGKGLAFEAAQASLDWYHGRRDVERTMCLMHPAHRVSIRLAERLGYQARGEIKYHDGSVAWFERRQALSP
jgi:RimJ/RimL family protein N-acetyltransferase